MDEVIGLRLVGVDRTAAQGAVGRSMQCAIKIDAARNARPLIQTNSKAGGVMGAGVRMFAHEAVGKNAVGESAGAIPGQQV
jgi:hypothetical protein